MKTKFFRKIQVQTRTTTSKTNLLFRTNIKSSPKGTHKKRKKIINTTPKIPRKLIHRKRTPILKIRTTTRTILQQIHIIPSETITIPISLGSLSKIKETTIQTKLQKKKSLVCLITSLKKRTSSLKTLTSTLKKILIKKYGTIMKIMAITTTESTTIKESLATIKC